MADERGKRLLRARMSLEGVRDSRQPRELQLGDAIASALIMIAEQGEEALEMFRERHAIGMAPHMEGTDGRPMGAYETGFTRGYEIGERDGKMRAALNAAGEALDSGEIAFEEGRRKGREESLGPVTKRLIDAALAVNDHLMGRRTVPPGPAYDGLIAAARAYRELMSKELR